MALDVAVGKKFVLVRESAFDWMDLMDSDLGYLLVRD